MTSLWRLKPIPPEALRLAAVAGVSLPEAQVLVHRGISDETKLALFLSPRLSSLLDPFEMKDMGEAVSLILEALENRNPLYVYGDHDADGLTATACLLNFFSGLGVPVSHYIPNRLTEGYGLNDAALRTISREGHGGALITVDCGISNSAEIALLHDLGMKVVITDHHQVPQGFMRTCPVVNPHQTDCLFPFKGLSGAGIAFFLLIALRARLRERGWFRDRPEPDLREFLDLVAIGTIADMVPLSEQNRILVSAGLDRIRESSWPGIRTMAEWSASGSSSTTADDIAFRIAPRLNASGRMGETETGISLLTAKSLPEARHLARRLDTLNSQRQDIERTILDQVEASIRSTVDLENRRTLVFAGRGWHRGVLGLVASRLAERYHRPSLVLDIRDGVAAGSGRSAAGFDLHRALTRLSPLLVRYGGHPHAAGLRMEVSRIRAFAEGFESIAREQLGPKDLIPAIDVDGEVGLEQLDIQTISRMRAYGPFGSGNPEPVFFSSSVEVLEAKIVGKRHLRLRVRKGDAVMEGIGFGLSERYAAARRKINLIHTPGIHQWQGQRKVELKILDFEEEGPTSKLERPASG